MKLIASSQFFMFLNLWMDTKAYMSESRQDIFLNIDTYIQKLLQDLEWIGLLFWFVWFFFVNTKYCQ